jgi:D-xylose transport system substrate-binding protein
VALSIRRAAVYAAAVVIGASSLAACGSNAAQSGSNGDSSASKSGGSTGSKSIALLLPESKTTRYEAFDKPLFEKKVAELCSDCKVSYFNADQDPAKQQQQVATAITKGVSAIVLDPVDGKAAAGLVRSAHAAKIPVVAYDRFIDGADYYLSFDNQRVGEMQAQALLKAMNNKGSILMLNGAPNDPNAAQFKQGAHKVLDASNVKVLAEYDNPDWSPENAQKWTTSQLGKFKASQITGVYAANDGQAGGVIAAMTGSGIAKNALPPITGQDAQLAAIQQILTGEQFVTIYKPIPVEANKAAEVAVDLATSKDITGTTTFQGVKSFIFTPIAVTKANIKDTVVKDKFYSVADICTKSYASACKAAGLS